MDLTKQAVNVVKAAYAEGVKRACLDAGVSLPQAEAYSTKIAEDDSDGVGALGGAGMGALGGAGLGAIALMIASALKGWGKPVNLLAGAKAQKGIKSLGDYGFKNWAQASAKGIKRAPLDSALQKGRAFGSDKLMRLADRLKRMSGGRPLPSAAGLGAVGGGALGMLGGGAAGALND